MQRPLPLLPLQTPSPPSWAGRCCTVCGLGRSGRTPTALGRAGGEWEWGWYTVGCFCRATPAMLCRLVSPPRRIHCRPTRQPSGLQLLPVQQLQLLIPLLLLLPRGSARRRPSETLRSLMESIFEAQREDPKLHVGIQRKPCGFVPPTAEYLRRASPAQRAQLHAAASAVVCAELARCSAGSVASSAAGEQRREYLLECQAKLSMLVEGRGSASPAESLEQQLRHADSAWSSDACVHGRCSLSRRAGEVKVVGVQRSSRGWLGWCGMGGLGHFTKQASWVSGKPAVCMACLSG